MVGVTASERNVGATDANGVARGAIGEGAGRLFDAGTTGALICSSVLCDVPLMMLTARAALAGGIRSAKDAFYPITCANISLASACVEGLVLFFKVDTTRSSSSP